jgi:CRP/FNR family cyclic AMP-dependent transcriptional regulator
VNAEMRGLAKKAGFEDTGLGDWQSVISRSVCRDSRACHKFEQARGADRALVSSCDGSFGRMRAVLDYCTGGTERQVAAGTLIVTEGGTTAHLYVLMQGKLEVLKGEMVVATVVEPGAVLGEMSVLLGQPHTATVRACSDSVVYEFEDAASFLAQEAGVALLIAKMLAQRLNVANTYLADLKQQYAGHGTHLAMVGEVLQSMINLPPLEVSPGSDRQSDPRM